MQQPSHQETVTIMVPTYNRAAFVEKSLQSLLRQTHQHLEILVCDDCSTDDTFDRVRALAKHDARITASQPFTENQGTCAMLNHMLEKAKTRFVARHDSDDLSHPDRIREQLMFMQNTPTAVLSTTRAQTLWQNSVMTSEWERDFIDPVASNDVPVNDSLLHAPRIMGGAMFGVRSQMVQSGGFEPQAFPMEDWFHALELSDKGSIFILDRVLYFRRLHAQNASKSAHVRTAAYAFIRSEHEVAGDIDHAKISIAF